MAGPSLALISPPCLYLIYKHRNHAFADDSFLHTHGLPMNSETRTSLRKPLNPWLCATVPIKQLSYKFRIFRVIRVGLSFNSA